MNILHMFFKSVLARRAKSRHFTAQNVAKPFGACVNSLYVLLQSFPKLIGFVAVWASMRLQCACRLLVIFVHDE